MKPSKIRITLAVCGALALLLSSALPARADAVISVSNVAAGTADTGDMLELTLTNTGPLDLSIGGFSFGLSVDPLSGVSFTDITILTASAPYIFSGSSAFGPDITDPGQTLPGAMITASDLTFDPSGATVASGATVGLGLVSFNVASSSLENVVVTLDGPATSLSDPSGVPINVDSLVDGSIDVVPEPGSLALFGMALVFATITRRHTPGRAPKAP